MAFREGPLHDLKLPLTWAAAAATLLAIIVALGLLLAGGRVGRGGSDAFSPLRDLLSRSLAPVASVVERPVEWAGMGAGEVGGYFFAVSENRRLKREIRDLEGWRDTAIALKNVNDRYESLLKLKTEPPVPMVSARSVTDARGPFANARLLDVGVEAGVGVGDPVISDHGAVGRIVGATRGASRMLLLTDVESRTPILVDRTNARAILTGDGGAYPLLEYVRGREPVRDGDMILTSGDGGVFPRGLPVGVAVRDLKGAWRVRMYADAAPIDYVRVLLFQDFGDRISPASLSGSPVPPLTASEEAERAAVLQQASTPAPAANASAQTQSLQTAAGKPKDRETTLAPTTSAKPKPAGKAVASHPAPDAPTTDVPRAERDPADVGDSPQ